MKARTTQSARSLTACLLLAGVALVPTAFGQEKPEPPAEVKQLNEQLFKAVGTRDAKAVANLLNRGAEPNTRVLFRRGDTFPSEGMRLVGCKGPVIVGAYTDPNMPSKVRPLIDGTGGLALQGVEDWRFVDLHFYHNTYVGPRFLSAKANSVTVHPNIISGTVGPGGLGALVEHADGNLHFGEDTAGLEKWLSERRAAGQCENSKVGDPQFLSLDPASPEFLKPAPGGPCEGLGAQVPEWKR